MNNLGLILFSSILSYVFGFGIAQFSLTETSQNAPITCVKGAIIFMLFKIYFYPYFKSKFIK